MSTRSDIPPAEPAAVCAVSHKATRARRQVLTMLSARARECERNLRDAAEFAQGVPAWPRAAACHRDEAARLALDAERIAREFAAECMA